MPGIEPRDLWNCKKELWPLDHRSGPFSWYHRKLWRIVTWLSVYFNNYLDRETITLKRRKWRFIRGHLKLGYIGRTKFFNSFIISISIRPTSLPLFFHFDFSCFIYIPLPVFARLSTCPNLLHRLILPLSLSFIFLLHFHILLQVLIREAGVKKWLIKSRSKW
jgi:hypothetical protein